MSKNDLSSLVKKQNDALPDPATQPTIYNLTVDFNVAEYLAKLETEKSIKTLVELRDDDEQPGAVRRSCANDLLNRGWGSPAQTIQVSRTEIKEQEIPKAVQDHTSLLLESQKYIGKVPIEEWPEHIREFMGLTLPIIDAEFEEGKENE